MNISFQNTLSKCTFLDQHGISKIQLSCHLSKPRPLMRAYGLGIHVQGWPPSPPPPPSPSPSPPLLLLLLLPLLLLLLLMHWPRPENEPSLCSDGTRYSREQEPRSAEGPEVEENPSLGRRQHIVHHRDRPGLLSVPRLLIPSMVVKLYGMGGVLFCKHKTSNYILAFSHELG